MPAEKPATTPQLFAQVRALTGLTPEALGRKLGVTVQELEQWADGSAPPPSKVLATLHGLLARASDPPRSGPRVAAPECPEGIVCADCISLLPTLPTNSVDLILSDIPYGIGLDEWDVLHANKNSAYMGSSAGQERAGAVFKRRRKPINGWSSADREIPRQYYDWCRSWAGEWLRVLKPGGSAILFAGRRFSPRCVVALEDAGFNFRDMLAWTRDRAVFRAQRLSVVFQKRGELAEAHRWTDWRVGNLRPTFEPILWCFKPYSVTIADNMLDHRLGAFNATSFERNTGGLENVIKATFVPGEAGHHEAQKPLKLLRTLLELCTLPGQLVMDPFAGSCSTAVAAVQTGRRYLAIEIDDALCEIGRTRVEREARLPVQRELAL